MRIFITGSTGFVGKHLVHLLLKKNIKILALVRNKKKIIINKNIKYVYGSIENPKKYLQSVIKFNPDFLIHLSYTGIPDYSLENSYKNLKISINFFESLLKKVKIKKIIAAGSCWEYSLRSGKLNELDNDSPDSYFAFSKNSLMSFISLKSREMSFDFCWNRIFYIYGEGQKQTSLIPNIFSSFDKNKLPNIRNLYNENDFIYVKDVAKIIYYQIIKKTPSGIYNIGSGKKISVKNIIKIIQKKFFNHININKLLNQKYIKKESYYANTNKINKIIKSNNYTKIDKGIENYYNYFLKEKNRDENKA